MRGQLRACLSSHACLLLQILVVGVQLLGLGYELLVDRPTGRPFRPLNLVSELHLEPPQSPQPASLDVWSEPALADPGLSPRQNVFAEAAAAADAITLAHDAYDGTDLRRIGVADADGADGGPSVGSVLDDDDSAPQPTGGPASVTLMPAVEEALDALAVAAPPTLVYFVAATEGAGGEMFGLTLMRQPRVRPMALVEEQSFVHLWWDESVRDVEVVRSTQEVFDDWTGAARKGGQHASFGARSCLRERTGKAADCSWVGGAQTQFAGRGLDPDVSLKLELTGEVFTYPFMQSSEPGEGQLSHYPQLSDLLLLSEHAKGAVEPRVLALWRKPELAFAALVGEMPQRFFRDHKLKERLRALAHRLLLGGQKAHVQMRTVPPQFVRVLDVESLLKHPQRFAPPLAAFLDLPTAHVAAALLPAVAHVRKRAVAASAMTSRHAAIMRGAMLEAEKEVLLQLDEEDRAHWWVDEIPRLACLPWGSQVLRNVSERKPTRVGAPAANDSRDRSMVLTPTMKGSVILTHVVNPFFAPGDEHARAVRMTLASLGLARAYAEASGLRIQQLAAVFPTDRGVVANLSNAQGIQEVALVGDLKALLPAVRHPHTLPLLRAILRAGYEHGIGEFLMYSNIDIALQEVAYVQLARLLIRQPLVPISAVREEFEHASSNFNLTDAARLRGHGLPHPGHDLWAFPRKWVADLQLRDVALGVSLVATALNLALYARSGCRLTQLSRRISFHVVEGESVVKHKWLQRARNDPIFKETYTAFNCVQVKLQLAAILNSTSNFHRCWIGQQVAKAMRAYKCAKNVASLPSLALRLAWDAPQPALINAFPMLAT